MKQLDLESVRAVELPIGSGELPEEEHVVTVTNDEVRAYYVDISPRLWIFLGAR